MRVLVALTLVVALACLHAPADAARSALPTKKRWLADVSRAMTGSQAYLKQRLARRAPSERLAVNLDVDNTALATKYERGRAIRVVLRFTRYADRHGIAVFFNTGRGPREGAAGARRALRRAGFPLDAFCHRRTGERLVHGKRRCRAAFVARGYTIVANVGNRSTDFAGGDYERAFRLPNYGNRLG